MVPLLKLVDRHMVSSCDLAKGVAFLDLVRYDPAGVFGVRSPFTEEGLWIQILGGLVGVEGILVGKEVVGVVVRDAQDVCFAASGDHVLDVLWVEVSPERYPTGSIIILSNLVLCFSE